jgi:lysine decarboxylase
VRRLHLPLHRITHRQLTEAAYPDRVPEPEDLGDRSEGDPSGVRGDAPLLDAWLTFTRAAGEGELHPFTIPGHKQRTDLVGPVVRGDVPLFGGLDTVGLAHGRLAEAERRAARAWDVDWCRFSVGGSTHGNQALALGAGTPGRPIVVTRTLHRSLLVGLVLADLRPVWVYPHVDPATGMPGAVSADDVRAALVDHPQACAVFVGDPSYLGTSGDVAGLAAAAHEAGVPLLVDAAWGAHFGFHPAFPPHPLAAGADALVTSAHKMLPAASQAALVLARTTRSGGLLDPDRLDRGFEATHTTSPNGAILASTDAARAVLQRDGHELLGRLQVAVARARHRLRDVAGLVIPAGPQPGGSVVDPAKLVLMLAGTGADGRSVEADLLAAGMPVELADRDTVMPIVTMADRQSDLDRLADALAASIERRRGSPRLVTPAAAWSVHPEQVLPPRAAFFARHRTVPADRAIGRVSAELIAPYPPGVPVLSPGERITADVVELLRAAAAAGTRIAYAADPTLATLQIVDEPD